VANTDKDILITPNNGSSSADPKIEFKGADASTSAQTITATAYPTNNGTLSFDGSAGQLFSITNDMTGTIFSVNDVSGIPSIEVDDDGTIRFAEYSGNVLIGTATDTGSTLQVKPDTDSSAEIGKAHIGYIGSANYAGFSHVDQNGSSTYALIHSSAGNTYLNATSGQAIRFRIANADKMRIFSTYTDSYNPIYNYSVYYDDYDALSGTSVTVNCDTAQAFSLTMTGNTTFTFNSVSNAWATGFVLELTGNGSTVTWPTSVDWAGGTAPDAPASGETDIYAFWSRDGGTTWYGVLSVDAAA
jgi:hypothetical protein